MTGPDLLSPDGRERFLELMAAALSRMSCRQCGWPMRANTDLCPRCGGWTNCHTQGFDKSHSSGYNSMVIGPHHARVASAGRALAVGAQWAAPDDTRM